jgi:hypothetical protein
MRLPLNSGAVRDALPAFFDLLREGTNSAVRVDLAYSLFVYIHTHMDGNCRMDAF